MGYKYYIILLVGLFFVGIGFWLAKKDKRELNELETKLIEKEKDLYDLFQICEEILQEMYRVYRLEHKVEEPVKMHGDSIPEEKHVKSDGIIPEDSIKKIELHESNKKNTGYSKKDKVLLLDSKGYNIDEIARELNMGKGEIRLMLDLKSK